MAHPSPALVPATDRRRRLAPLTDGGRRSGPVTADDLDWLGEVLGAVDGAEPVHYLARVAGDEVRFLAPARPAAATAAALHRLGDDRSRARQAQAAVGRLAGRAGLLGRLPGAVRLALPPFALVDHLARALGEPDLAVAVTLGPRRRNRKPVVQLIRPDGSVVGFAKVGWSPLTAELVDNEADTLRLVAGRIDPAVVVAPTVLLHDRWDGRSVAVLSPLQPTGPAPGRPAPGGTGPTGLAAVAAAIAACEPAAPRPVGALPVLAGWAADGLGDTVDLDRLARRHQGVTLATGLWHGDLTPWNLTTRGATTWVWDWELAGPGRPVGLDLLHHRFEHHRRRPGTTAADALTAAIVDAPSVLAPLDRELTGRRLAALVDLHLCELIARERRLDGQRWASPLADLAPAATTLLARRLQTTP
ncbi:MAG: hypothetical protein R2761_24910 [Acidimicrobiales bacterium]